MRRKSKVTGGRVIDGVDEDERETCLVMDLLNGERHLLREAVIHSVKFHRLTPIIESARDEHLVRVVRPANARNRPVSDPILSVTFVRATIRSDEEAGPESRFRESDKDSPSECKGPHCWRM